MDMSQWVTQNQAQFEWDFIFISFLTEEYR